VLSHTSNGTGFGCAIPTPASLGMWIDSGENVGGGREAGSTLEQALVHPIMEHWRATFQGGKGPSTLAGLFHSTYLKIPKWDKNGQK
jgi:hypothetical protein